MEICNFWVDIENAAGVRQGAGPLRARVFNVSTPLSASGEFSFEVSIADPNIGALAEKRSAICRYIDREGAIQTFGGGVIDSIVTTIAADGSTILTVSGNDLGRELTYRSVGALVLAGSSPVMDGPQQIMELAPDGWTLQEGITAKDVYLGFDGESVLNALTRVGQAIGEHWRIEAGRVVNWLGPATGFAASGIRAIQHVNDVVGIEDIDGIAVITGLKVKSDAAGLATRVIPRGSGNGSAITTLEFCTDAAPEGYTLNAADNYVMHNAAEDAYGRIERPVQFKEVGPLENTTEDIQQAANMLLNMAVEYLRGICAPQKFYELSLAHVNQLLLPGTTIYVVYRELLDGAVVYDLDDDFIINESKNSIDATGLHTTSITVSTIDRLPISDNALLSGHMQEIRILATHQQPVANVDTLTWRDEIDASHAASFYFRLGDDYLSIPRALLRFIFSPLALEDLVIKLNGGDDLSSQVVDIGNDWYELDLTGELMDETFRPAYENNMIEISTEANESAQIEAQLNLRAVVQAIYTND
jgi:hypothetical protein